jgi:hypothetical protein
MTTSATVLLDFDGVLNALGKEQPTSWPDFRRERAQGYPLWLSKAMCAEVWGLDTQIQWLSTWNEDDAANLEVCPLLGWPRLPVAGVPPPQTLSGRKGPNDWKCLAVKAFLEANKGPVVWIDDDAEGLTMQFRWRTKAYDRHPLTDTPDRLLVVSPSDTMGLESDDIEAIRDWLSQWPKE